MTTPMDDLGRVRQSDTLGTLRQSLLELGKAALAKHPILHAMATQIRVTDQGSVWFTFDGPALPVKQNCEVRLPEDPASHGHMLDAFMGVCEDTVARAMRQASYSWAHARGCSPDVASGGGGACGGGQDTGGMGGASTGLAGAQGLGAAGGAPSCGPVRVAETHGVAQGGGSGSACESEPSFHGTGGVD